MSVGSRHAFALAMLVCGVLLGAGCAKDATTVLVAVDADATVPPLLILRTIIARADDPSRRASSDRSSPYAGDAADRPGPFVFPLELPLTIDASLAGPVTITVEGLDWDNRAVTARGAGDAVAVAQSTTRAALTMTATPPAGNDGGAD